MEFYNGAALISTATGSPFSYTWTYVPAGSYSLTARAYDNYGLEGNSTPVQITVNQGNTLPTVSITAPTTGASYTAPATVAITASASSTDSTINKVQFYQGTTLLGTASTSPYTFTWSNVANGVYTLTATAYDNFGLQSTSSAVTVTVDAAAPPTTGLKLWLKADAITGIGNGNPIATWPDSSGLGNNATQGTPAYQPTFVSADLNGEPAVRFTSANTQCMTIGSGFNGNLNTLTEIAVLKASHAYALFQSQPYQGDNLCFDNYTDTISHACDISANVDASKFPTGGMVTVTCNRDGGNHLLLSTYSNGALFSGPITGDTNTIYIYNSSLANNNNSVYFNGDLCEFMVYDHVLTPNDKQTVESYLAGKYGLAVTMDAPPAVTLSTDKSLYTPPGTVLMTANATDGDGTVSQVQFYNGATLLATVSASPYTFTWSNVALGNYTLTAQATDNAGLVTTSNAVNITVDVLPTVALTTPANGATYSAPASITLNATASSGTTTISKVEFYNGNALLGTSTSSPYSFTWSNIGVGGYTLTAKAYDSIGTVNSSSPATISVEASAPPATGMMLWLKADAITGIGNGNPIATWPDSSGLGNNATQTTSGIQPTYITGDLNGKPAVRFASANSQYMNIAAGFNGALNTVTEIAVLKGANARSLFQTEPFWGDNLVYDSWTDTISHACDISANVDTSKFPTGGMVTVICNRDGNNDLLLSTYSNGALYSGPITGDTNPVYIGNSFLGNNNYAAYFNGDLCEFMVYDHVLTPNDQQTAESYLAGKYGLGVTLASPPIVNLTTDYSTYLPPATVVMTATATDPNGSISQVQFYNGATLLATVTASPYVYTWSNVAAGSYTLTAIATDNSGLCTTSAAVNITVQGSCAAPTFNPVAGTYGAAQSVTISTTTNGATLRYTTDGSTPTETAGTLYSSAVNISVNTTLKAIAYETGYTDSTVASGNYYIQCSAPSFNPAPGAYGPAQSVTISTTTSGASIRYTTNGTTPSSTVGTVYSSSVAISATSTLQAIAYETGLVNSGVTSGVYTINGACAAPTFNPAAGTFTTSTSVTISTTTGGATIMYTTNGTTPSSTVGTVYSSAVSITASSTLQAIAYETGYSNSSVASGVYTIQCAAPTFNPAAGAYGPAQSVTISTTTSGASIRYTTNGTTPSSTVGTVYSSPVAISATSTLQAIAYETGLLNSTVTSGVYTINGACTTPTFNPAAGTFTTSTSVTISTTTGGATIRYTTNGTTPSSTVGTVYSSAVSITASSTLQAIAYETGYSNSGVASGVYTITACATPSFNPAAGTYTSATVTISTATTGASIRYTTNGTTPSSTVGTVYSSPVAIGQTGTLQAIAYETGYTNSTVTTGAYTIYIGTTTAGSTSTAITANRINGTRFQAGSAMTINHIDLDISSSVSGNIQCAIYTDSSSVPGTLLMGTNALNNPGTGWQTFTLTSSQALTSWHLLLADALVGGQLQGV